MTPTLSREGAVEISSAALLIIDVQNYAARRDGGQFQNMSDARIESDYGEYFRQLDGCTVPNLSRLLAGGRAAGIEVLFTTIESLTLDGRDRSLDYKITGFHVPRGSRDGRVIDPLAPRDDEIVLAKTSSSVFVSTNIDYLLRNLGIRYLVVGGLLTDQCVESAVRDACDLGYLVTVVTDACAAYTRQRHDNALAAISGYCRQRTTDEFLSEITRDAATG